MPRPVSRLLARTRLGRSILLAGPLRRTNDDDTGGGGGGGGGGGAGGRGGEGGRDSRESDEDDRGGRRAPRRRRRLSDEDWTAIDRAADQYGSVEDALLHFRGDNYRLRERLRRRSEGKADDEPIPEGHRLLKPEEVAAYEAYLKLGKPEEITTGLQERDTLKTEKARIDFRDTLRRAATFEAVNYNPDVFVDLVESKGLVVEFRPVELEGGKKEERPFLRENRDGAEALFVPEFIDKNLKGYKLALEAGADTSSQGDDRSTGGTRFTRTPAGGSAPKTGDLTAVVGRRDIRPSQLRGGATNNGATK